MQQPKVKENEKPKLIKNLFITCWVLEMQQKQKQNEENKT